MPELPLMTEMATEFCPIRKASAGMANGQVWLMPRQVPRVTLREFSFIGGGESPLGEVKPPIAMAGRRRRTLWSRKPVSLA